MKCFKQFDNTFCLYVLFETSNDIREKTDNHLRVHSPITFSLVRVHDETY